MYTIERIRNKDGTTHEREIRRKGHRVFIAHVQLGKPLEIVYVDDGDKVLHTSPIEAYNEGWNEKGHLVVQTKNTVYTFRKEKVTE